jgi:2-dehydropantoate 2-reductase
MGTGAVGGYFGGRLASAGLDVTFIARGETLEALKREGLTVESSEGDIRLTGLQVADEPSRVGNVDLVLFGVKAWQVPAAAEQLHPLVGERTVLLPLQNGVEAADQLASVHGPGRVLGGTCRIVAFKSRPAVIKHVGVEPFISLGELDHGESERVDRIVDTLNRAGIGARRSRDIHAAIWMKFLFIAPVSGVGAVTRQTIGMMRTVQETRALLKRAMEEVYTVALARGISLKPEAVEKTMAFLDGMPFESTASMQRDLMEGRPSELESINGAVVRLGRSRNVATPVNEFLYASLLPMERAARGMR